MVGRGKKNELLIFRARLQTPWRAQQGIANGRHLSSLRTGDGHLAGTRSFILVSVVAVAGAATVMEAVLLMVLPLVMVGVELLLLRLKFLPILLAFILFFLVERLVVVEMVEVLGFTWYL